MFLEYIWIFLPSSLLYLIFVNNIYRILIKKGEDSMIDTALQLIGGGLISISSIFLLFNIKKYKNFEKRDDVKFYKGIIESVETDGGLTCNVRLDEIGELIKIYSMDSIVVMEYSPDSDRITNNYDTLIGRKIKISKDANGKIEYDIAYKKKIRISLLYLIIGVTLFLVSLMQ